MVLSCGLLDVMDLVWWQPYHKPLEKGGSKRHSSAWLPGAIEITSDPDKAEVCTCALQVPELSPGRWALCCRGAEAGSEQLRVRGREA